MDPKLDNANVSNGDRKHFAQKPYSGKYHRFIPYMSVATHAINQTVWEIYLILIFTLLHFIEFGVFLLCFFLFLDKRWETKVPD